METFFEAWLSIDQGGALTEDAEFLVETCSLVLVLRVVNLLNCAQIKDHLGKWSMTDIGHPLLCLEVKH